jgi:transposase, IS5 family
MKCAKKVAFLNMINKTSTQFKLGIYSVYEDQLNTKHPLFKLSKAIDWNVFEKEFSKYYSSKMGKPAKPIRLMVSC